MSVGHINVVRPSDTEVLRWSLSSLPLGGSGRPSYNRQAREEIKMSGTPRLTDEDLCILCRVEIPQAPQGLSGIAFARLPASEALLASLEALALGRESPADRAELGGVIRPGS